MKQLLFFLILEIFFLRAQAAPYPATSSSALINPAKGLYLLNKGFTLKTDESTWLPTLTDPESSEIMRYSGRNLASEAHLSVKIDKVAKNATLNLYARKWLKEYHNYGFEVISNKNFTLNNQPAMVVDLLSRPKKKQLRQVILKHEEQIVVMTCSDQIDQFDKSVQQCNNIIKTFTWNAENPSLLIKK